MNRVLFLLFILVFVSCSTLRRTTEQVDHKSLTDNSTFVAPLTNPLFLDSVPLPEHLQTRLVFQYNLTEKATSEVHPTFYPITAPYQKMRNDTRGEGHFGASRGYRTHNGLDIIVTPGSAVYCPIQGIMFREAYPYGTAGKNAQWEGCLIVGLGEYTGYEVKIFYMRPFLIGEYVYPGEIIGVAQAISQKYTPDMIDHLHVEVRRNGQLLNPATLFELIK